MFKPIMSLRNFFVTEDTQGAKLTVHSAEETEEKPEGEPEDSDDPDSKEEEKEADPTPEGETPEASISVLTARATKAEASVETLTKQVTTLTQERDRYKAWYDKQAGSGKSLPAADASDTQEKTAYNSHAQQVWKQTH